MRITWRRALEQITMSGRWRVAAISEMRLKFFEVDQVLEMVRVVLVTILAREMRLKFFEVDQRLEMLRVALVTILVLEMRWKFFEVDKRLEVLRVALVTVLARKMRLKIFSSHSSFGDVASAAGHHYWCEKCDWNFSKSTKVWWCCEWRWSRYLRENCDRNFLKSTNVWKCCEWR